MTPQYREKYVDLRTSGETGVSEAIRFDAGHVKTASIKLDLLDALLRSAVDQLRPTEGKLYVLVYAMGAGEYWGANRNSDYFPEKVLSGEDPDNGYRSFLKAGIFRDHALNKQIEHSFGRVMVSVYNRRMHRIELLIEVDRLKAAAEGHQDLIDRLDAGEPVPVSMGCRTPVDICSACGHHSKVDADRCDCIRTQRNTILPDGRLVCMINPMCKAFDLSFVTIGADPSALTIAKLARFGGAKLPPYKPLLPPVARNKVASSKLAELIKRVPGMSAMQNAEPGISSPLLADMAKRPLSAGLSSAGVLGIMLKPSEFQRLVLLQNGRGELADGLDQARVSIPCDMPPAPGAEVGTHALEQNLIYRLRAVASERSAYQHSLQPRIQGMAVKVASHRYTPARAGQDRTLDAIGCLYTGYRNSLLEKIATEFNKVASHDPSMLNTMYPDELGLLGLVKVGSTVRRNDMVGPLTLPYLLTHVYSRGGEDAVAEYVTSHPEIASAYLGIL